MTNQTMGSSASLPAVIAEHRTWFMVLGVVLLLLGVLAIIFPFATTIAAKVALGWLFLIGGVVQIIQSFSTQKWSGFILNLIIGVLYLLAGAWLAFFPLTGIITLTIFLAALFIVNGVLEIGMGFRLRDRSGWFWMLLSGIIGVILGVWLFIGLPETATWAIGLVVGINLVTSGLAYILLPMVAIPSRM
jgi:uncharacterized membrane protein HdeD (DUF308 family)